MTTPLGEQLTELHMKKKKCVVLTGAGISAESGLKTFRDEGGLWEGHNVEDVATPRGFRKNPQLVIDFYNARRMQLKEAKPNKAHLSLVDLEKKYNVIVITQNVDDLHEKAGSSNILHLHGELKKLRSTVDEDYVIDFDGEQTLDMKDPKGNPMRPHIVWFEEAVPLYPVAVELVRDADVVIIVGTSMVVQPAASIVYSAPPGAKIYYVDPNADTAGMGYGNQGGVKRVKAVATQGVPEVVEELLKED